MVASRRWRESRGLAAWLHRAGTRGRTIDRRLDDGEEVAARDPHRAARQHLWRRRPRPTCISGHRGGQTFTSNLMLHYWKDVPALIEDHWNTGPQGQTNIYIYLQHPRKHLFYSGHHAGIFCVRISNTSILTKITRTLFGLQSEASC